MPKDFDVITTANLEQIKNKFHRAFIVGSRFPICKVHVKGSAIEVSSFETLAWHAKEKEVHLSEMPKGYDEKDIIHWRNSLHRDFTINSLFYDPFAHKIYDYSNGMTDLRYMKLRTLIPAHLSFQEDCARILRGLRIAARLGLSLAKETEKAIHNFYDSVKTLDKGRLMMEMNYMLSYGAAEPSILLLRRFNLLEVLLPFHAAYLANHSDHVMLMKLFFNLDSVVSCDQPCDSGLWVSRLAFHLALVNNPQDALVVWTFSSALYHGKWKKGVKAARELAEEPVNFVPEILESSNDATDEELVQRVANFASMVLDSIDALTDSESLLKAMSLYPSSPRSGLVFISKNAGKEVAEIFDVVVDNIKSLKEERHSYIVDYKLLRKGDISETRFVLGKVVMDTMRAGVTKCQSKLVTEKKDDFFVRQPEVGKVVGQPPTSVDSDIETPKMKARAKRGLSVTNDQLHQKSCKKQKQNKKIQSALQQKLVKEKFDILSCQDIAKKKQQLKKVVVKDVKKLLSLQKEVKKKGTELKMVKFRGGQAPLEILSVIEKAPKMAEEHEAQVKQQEALGHKEKLSVPEELSEKAKQQEDVKQEEHQVGEQPEDQSKERRRIRKLSSIFR